MTAGLSGRTSSKIRLFLPFAGALCIGASSAVWIRSQSEEKQGPSLFHYAPLFLRSAHILPSDASNMFDPNEKPVHRHLQMASHTPLRVDELERADEETSPASETQDVRSCFALYAYYIKEPTIQVERPYTPLRLLNRSDPCILDMLIKRYTDGELSRYLHRLRVGAPVYIRGPELSWHLNPAQNCPDEIVMLVGGTGIAASHQLLSNVFDAKKEGHVPYQVPKMTIWYAARSMDSLQMLPEFVRYAKAYPEHVSLRLWVESMPPTAKSTSTAHSNACAMTYTAEGQGVQAQLYPVTRKPSWISHWTASAPSEYILALDGMHVPVQCGRIGKKDLQVWHPYSDTWRRMFLVCGPDGFVHALAGPKGRDLVSQGPLGGMLATLGYRATDVFKL